MKVKLIIALVLTIIVPGGKLVEFIDATGTSFGFVFMLNKKNVAYALRKLKHNERRYLIHDLELAVIVYEPHYLFGECFDLYTYHKGLKYLFS